MATNDPEGQPFRPIIGESVLAGHLRNTVPDRDLISMFPLTLTFSDDNGVEKLAILPQELSTEGMPTGDDPLPGDIGYYAPGNNLVLYDDDVGFFNGIVRLGRFTTSLDLVASQALDFEATITVDE